MCVVATDAFRVVLCSVSCESVEAVIFRDTVTVSDLVGTIEEVEVS